MSWRVHVAAVIGAAGLSGPGRSQVFIAPSRWKPRVRVQLTSPLRMIFFAAMIIVTLPPAIAQHSDAKPFDERLSRLAEILGAVHYLRELCGSNDGQMWRERMREIADGEGASASRRAKFARSFNSGYRGYSRTYQTCSPTAQTAINRFMVEGVQIADALIKSVP